MRFFSTLLVFLWLPFAAVAQNSDEGPGYLAGLLQDALSGAGRDVQIRGFEGALSSEASIRLLSISDSEGEWFRAENVALVWTRSALLRGVVDVNSFTAEKIIVSRAPVAEDALPSAEAAPFQFPELPVSVIIEEINARSVVLGAPLAGEEAEFSVTGAARLEGRDANIRFNLERIDGKRAQVALTAAYDPETRALSLDLAAEEAAGGIVGQLLDIPGQPDLALTVQGEGGIDAFTADLALTTEGQPRVAGTIEILAPQDAQSWDVRVDIDGDPTPLLSPEMQDFFGNDISLQARVIRDASGRIDLPELTLAARALALNGTAAIGANGWPETFDVQLRMVHPEGDPVVLPFGDGQTRVADVTVDAVYDTELTFDARMTEFQSPEATLERVTITGRGDIDPQSLASSGQLDLDLTWDADGLDLRDPALAQAVGSRLSGAANVNYMSGQPLRITGLEATGEDYGLTGTAAWDSERTIPLGLDLRLVAQDLVRFSALAGRDLSGRAEITIDGAVGPVSGTADVVIDATTLDLQIDQIVADRVLGGIGSARIDVRRDETGTTLREARVVTSGATFEATGKITSADTALRFEGDVRRLDLLYPGEADGSATVSGTASLRGTQLVRSELSMTLDNQSQPVTLPLNGGLTLDTGTVEVIATGGPEGSWTAQIQVTDVASQVLSSDLLELSGAGPLEQSDTGGLVSIGGELSVAGTGLRMTDPRLSQALGAAPSVLAEFDWTQDSARLELAQFRLDTGLLVATGSALVVDTLTAPDARFALSLAADDLSPLSGLAGQSVRGRGMLDVTGSYAQGGPFDVRVAGEASGLGIGNPVANRLLAGVTRIDVTVAGQDNAVDRVSAQVSNPDITARVNGSLTALDISARLRDMGLIAPDLSGPLQVDGTVGLENEVVTVDAKVDVQGNTALASRRAVGGRGTFDVTGSYAQGGPFDVRVAGEASGLGIGNPVANRLLAGVTRIDVTVAGQDNAVDRVSAQVSNPEITARVNGPLTALDISARLRNLGLIAPDFSGPLQVDGTVGHATDVVTVDVNVDAPGNTTLAIDGSVRGGNTADLTIRGDAPLGLANAFIAPRRLNGRAQLDLAMRGPLALSSLSGVVTPTAAELSAPTLGIILAPITGQIGLQAGAAQIGLSAQGNNGGSLDVNGRLALEGLAANLTVTLNRFGVRDPALYDTSVDGTISVTGPIGRDLLIAGDLRLNQTEIQVPSSGAFALGDIPEIQHLGATRPVMRTIERAGLNETRSEVDSRSSPATTRLDLSLTAPNRVFVRGRGLDAELGGALRLTGPTNNIIPQGGFELVRGRLDVLNQRFVLNEGRIQLSGSFVPVLRFVASTEANGIVVNVILDGPASSPDISFTSAPELPEDEVLAQLLFGRDLSNLSAVQALELANAVATLAGGGAGGLLSRLRDGFGLDDLDVSETEDGNAALRAGAYISDNVYTDVVVESGGRTEINLNLDITSDITARGSVSNDGNSSLGIFFERDY